MFFDRQIKNGFAALALAAALLTGGQARAGVFVTNTLINGINTYEDKSRDIVVDVDGSGTLTKDDILYGFARLDNKATAPSGLLSTDSDYVVFSQTISSIIGGVVSFIPTVGTYSLSTLTGDAIAPTAFFALYEDTGAGGFGDLLNNAAGAANIATIAAGTFILSAGLGLAPSNADDYFQAFAFNASLAQPPTPGAPGIGSTVAFFTAGMTILQQPGVPSVVFNESVAGVPFIGPAGLHQFGVGSGAAQNAGPLDPILNPSGYNYFDSLKVTVDVTLVPEPISFVVWGGLMGLGFVGAIRRRRA